MKINPKWENVFQKTYDAGLKDYFDVLGEHFYEFYQSFNKKGEIKYSYTKDQENEFSLFFSNLNSIYLSVNGIEYIATVRRRETINIKGVIQCWSPKEWYVDGPGKGPIPFMGAQFDPKYRQQEHEDLLAKIPEGQCPVKTFGQENKFASQYPYARSRSMLGDAGIGAHISFAKIKSFFGYK